MYSKWTGLPLHTRQEIARVFGIAKVSPTHVQDDRIVSDGYKIEDVENALSEDALRKFTGSSSKDFLQLFDLTVAKVEGKVLPVPETEIAALVSEPTAISIGSVEPMPDEKPIVLKPKKTTKKK